MMEDSEKKMEKENLGQRLDLSLGELEGSLRSVLPNTAMKKKVLVLLMGKSGSGKTSMRAIIFANYIARDTRHCAATTDVEHSHVQFLGNLILNLWDCGGQDTFMENYFTSQWDNIFQNVEVLIYVFDVESRELEKDMHYYQSRLEAILQNSPDAKIFRLVLKMDLQLEPNLRNLTEIIETDEVLLFERATVLVVSHYQCKEYRDAHRFEKISNIIKQFKLSCSKLAASFQTVEIRNSTFAAFIDIQHLCDGRDA
ncbi:Ras-related GTP-binding protein B [Tupaia chinensis]|uniref:Ras-related GTP-binding protein n=1 Tax=Tupaia chinensis TaxID=246437 RepID=L9KN58_TUPCH|nr:Ras-related GTP-binding protein B [Tupaia chinensis]